MTAPQPTVGVVLPTHARPELLAIALAAVAAQDYDGQVKAVVVFDRAPPDRGLERGGPRPVRVMSNNRTPGLAGARNSGILSLDADLVAFCDDDDVWEPGKLTAQVAALDRQPAAHFATCAITVAYGDRLTPRLAGSHEINHADLLRSRMSMLHSSTFLADRAWLVDRVGLLDEAAPGSQNEDWDLLLRVTRHGPVAHIDVPLVRVLWGSSSYFSQQWESKAASLQYMLAKHPDIEDSAVGAARVYAQLAFAKAALGNRREAAALAGRALRLHQREWRAPVALAVAGGLVSPKRVLDVLHRFGRGV